MADKLMVVIGGSRGIGAAVARMAAAEGWQVLLTYSSRQAEAETLVDAIVQEGGTARSMACDAADEAALVAVFAEARTIGGLRAVVFSSGITGAASPLVRASAQTIRRVIEVNLTGAIIAAREAVRCMALSEGGAGGSLVFISSRASERGSAGEYVWYAASKGGVNSLALGLAREVAHESIRVNCVSPGPVATEMLSAERQAQGAAAVPMQRVAEPEEIARAVLFLTSEAASYVTAANLAVAGGA